MNEKLYLDTLKKYQKWAKENKKQVEQDFTERRAMCEDMQAYSKERLAKLTEEEFYELIAPLWAMRIWGNKKYYIDNILESNGMEVGRRDRYLYRMD